MNSKSKRGSKSATGGDKKSEEKPSLASKLAAAVSKRKSKTLAPTATEDTIIEGIKESPSKEAKRSRSTRSKSSKSCREAEEEKQSTSKASCSNSRKQDKTSEHTKEINIKSKSQTVMNSDNSDMYKQNYWVEVFLNNEKRKIKLDEKVINFKKKIIEDQANRFSNIKIIDEIDFDKLTNEIKDLDVIYPSIGENLSFLKSIKKKKSLNYNFIVREGDEFCWQFSNKGYFNFKSNIPKIIQKIT